MHSEKSKEENRKCNIFIHLKLLNKIQCHKNRDSFGEYNIKEVTNFYCEMKIEENAVWGKGRR
jgi:hypothetical protein